MERKVITILMIITVALSACSKVSITEKEDLEPKTDTEIVGEIVEKPIEIEKPSGNSETIVEMNWQDDENPEKGKHTVTIEKGYMSSFMEVNMLGAEEYKIIEGKNLNDVAPEGERYLVVYLEMKNLSSKNEYFNYNYVKSYCDGKEIQTTFLINDPKGYKPIFNDIPGNGERKGYLVYKVPEGWKRLEMVYTGFMDTRQLELRFDISSDNLKDAEAIE